MIFWKKKRNWSRLPDNLHNKIQFEISEIDYLLESYDSLLKKARGSILNKVELLATAALLQSFYNGLEKIFIVIKKQLDMQIPSGQKWHHELLEAMTSKTDKRQNVISASSRKILREYMAFRHFFRHSYSFELDQEKIKKLIVELRTNWNKIKADIMAFIGKR